MKVILINGSPHEKGCTYTALQIVGEALNKAGIETETFHTGSVPVQVALGKAKENTLIADFLERAKNADGFVFGSPVHFAAMSASLKAFMDQVFFDAKDDLAYKPGAIIASARRAGTTATLDEMYKYLAFNNMPIVSSRYWNMVHGNTPAQVMQDEEGIQIMQHLGENMAWLLKCIELGKENGIEHDEIQKAVRTNFIR